MLQFRAITAGPDGGTVMDGDFLPIATATFSFSRREAVTTCTHSAEFGNNSMEAKRKALEALALGSKTAGYDTSHDKS